MSIKLKVSYTDEKELDGVLRLFSSSHQVKECRKQPQKGRYKRAYIMLTDNNSGVSERK